METVNYSVDNSQLFYFRSNPPTPNELKSRISSIPPDEKEDRLLNYGLQVIRLGVFLMQLNDTEAEGDGEHSIINCKMLMLFYRCKSRGMKYACEAMRFIRCVSRARNFLFNSRVPSDKWNCILLVQTTKSVVQKKTQGLTV